MEGGRRGGGAGVRAQVPTVVGLLVWLLFVENSLGEGVPRVAEFAPGGLGRAIAGGTEGTLAPPVIGALLLAIYATAALAAGWRAATRRDFA